MEFLGGYLVWGRWELKRKFRLVTGNLYLTGAISCYLSTKSAKGTTHETLSKCCCIDPPDRRNLADVFAVPRPRNQECILAAE